jgi:hypothetical protein
MYSSIPPPRRLVGGSEVSVLPTTHVDPQASMTSGHSVRESLKPPEQFGLLSFPLNVPKKIWVHVSDLVNQTLRTAAGLSDHMYLQNIKPRSFETTKTH